MGIEALLSLSITAASGLAQRSAARRAARARRTSNEIQTATGEIGNVIARRRSARQERIRRARLINSSRASGTAVSSGAFGALSAISSNFGAARSLQSVQELAARGLSAASQREASANERIQTIGQITQFANQGLEIASDAGLFDTGD